jgi:hypothetical protein
MFPESSVAPALPPQAVYLWAMCNCRQGGPVGEGCYQEAGCACCLLGAWRQSPLLPKAAKQALLPLSASTYAWNVGLWKQSSPPSLHGGSPGLTSGLLGLRFTYHSQRTTQAQCVTAWRPFRRPWLGPFPLPPVSLGSFIKRGHPASSTTSIPLHHEWQCQSAYLSTMIRNQEVKRRDWFRVPCNT